MSTTSTDAAGEAPSGDETIKVMDDKRFPRVRYQDVLAFADGSPNDLSLTSKSWILKAILRGVKYEIATMKGFSVNVALGFDAPSQVDIDQRQRLRDATRRSIQGKVRVAANELQDIAAVMQGKRTELNNIFYVLGVPELSVATISVQSVEQQIDSDNWKSSTGFGLAITLLLAGDTSAAKVFSTDFLDTITVVKYDFESLIPMLYNAAMGSADRQRMEQSRRNLRDSLPDAEDQKMVPLNEFTSFGTLPAKAREVTVIAKSIVSSLDLLIDKLKEIEEHLGRFDENLGSSSAQDEALVTAISYTLAQLPGTTTIPWQLENMEGGLNFSDLIPLPDAESIASGNQPDSGIIGYTAELMQEKSELRELLTRFRDSFAPHITKKDDVTNGMINVSAGDGPSDELRLLQQVATLLKGSIEGVIPISSRGIITSGDISNMNDGIIGMTDISKVKEEVEILNNFVKANIPPRRWVTAFRLPTTGLGNALVGLWEKSTEGVHDFSGSYRQPLSFRDIYKHFSTTGDNDSGFGYSLATVSILDKEKREGFVRDPPSIQPSPPLGGNVRRGPRRG
uniref:Uncharacterized protein n=1 Tax=viral metagenome TaxID=1070528 RepID=A0A2V0RJZ7_9ZZZZ